MISEPCCSCAIFPKEDLAKSREVFQLLVEVVEVRGSLDYLASRSFDFIQGLSLAVPCHEVQDDVPVVLFV